MQKENIKIFSRKQIEKLALFPFPPNTALISIRDANAEIPKLKHKPTWLLQLAFDDISSDEIDDYKGKEYTLFDESIARKIADFVDECKDKAEPIICQCEYGQSRSAAVAAALSEFFCQSGIDIFADDRYYPNKLAFRLTLKALMEKGQEMPDIKVPTAWMIRRDGKEKAPTL